jgi:hypothetical protein
MQQSRMPQYIVAWVMAYFSWGSEWPPNKDKSCAALKNCTIFL